MANENLTFRGQREDEEVILLIHPHPWVLLRRGLFVALGAATIILMFVFFQASRPSTWTLFILGPITLVYAAYAWYLWSNTMYLLTNERIIVITQSNLFSRRIEDYSLDKIQSVASETAGAAGTALNFGPVMLAIMGIKDQVTLPFVEDPYDVQEKVLTAMKKGSVTINNYQEEKKPKKRLIQN